MAGRGWPVCGHQRVIQLLAGEIRDRRVRHAYLISGPVSVGKSTVADAFAASLICSNAKLTGSACGECDDCRRVGRHIHPDVQRFSLASQRLLAKEKTSGESLTVETVREITSVSALRAYSAEYRVIILEDAGTLTEIAQEALLKTLEEPPPQLVLILLTDRAESLLPTIRSRCESLSLSPVSPPEIAECLESAGQSPETARELADLSQGLPGWALRATENSTMIEARSDARDRVREWVDGTPFDRIVRSFDLANLFTNSREDVFSELNVTAEYWRTVMMDAARSGDAVSGAVGLPAVSLTDSYGALTSVLQCVSDLEHNVRPRLALESMVMKWPVNQAGK